MLKSDSGEIKWSRLVIIAALIMLASALWLSSRRGDVGSPTAIGAPSGNASITSPDSVTSPDLTAPANPQDPTGWRALGEARFQAERYADAVVAYQHAVTLAPGYATTWAALGEARVMASAHDPMPAEALKDFREAARLDPREPRARYFLAVAKDLTGNHDGAIADWLALLADTPPGAPWEADLRRTIEQVGRLHHLDVASRIAALPRSAVSRPGAAVSGQPPSSIAGPTDQDLAAASAIPPSQQQAMAIAMVARLEQRLAGDPHNGEGWAMLIRSRLTLDGEGAAAAALARAVTADPADAAQLRATAQALGVK